MSHETNPIADDLEQARLYAWNDPILDRAVFEGRLQEEPHLAVLVAEAVGDYMEIHAALASYAPPKKPILAVPSSQSNRSIRYLVNAAWALSIAVAVAVLVVPTQWNSDTEGTLPMSSLAQIWSELQFQPSPSLMVEQTDSALDTTEEYGVFELSISDDVDLDLPDWLVAATSYQTSNAGVTP